MLSREYDSLKLTILGFKKYRSDIEDLDERSPQPMERIVASQ